MDNNYLKDNAAHLCASFMSIFYFFNLSILMQLLVAFREFI